MSLPGLIDLQEAWREVTGLARSIANGFKALSGALIFLFRHAIATVGLST